MLFYNVHSVISSSKQNLRHCRLSNANNMCCMFKLFIIPFTVTSMIAAISIITAKDHVQTYKKIKKLQ